MFILFCPSQIKTKFIILYFIFDDVLQMTCYRLNAKRLKYFFPITYAILSIIFIFILLDLIFSIFSLNLFSIPLLCTCRPTTRNVHCTLSVRCLVVYRYYYFLSEGSFNIHTLIMLNFYRNTICNAMRSMLFKFMKNIVQQKFQCLEKCELYFFYFFGGKKYILCFKNNILFI